MTTEKKVTFEFAVRNQFGDIVEDSRSEYIIEAMQHFRDHDGAEIVGRITSTTVYEDDREIRTVSKVEDWNRVRLTRPKGGEG